MVTAQPIYSPIIFIGREQEMSTMMDLLHADVDDPRSKWMLAIHGEGGIGKTQLLYQFAKAAQSHYLDSHRLEPHTVIGVAHPIDFYLTANQTEAGILKSLADQLPQAEFQAFYTVLYGEYQRSGDEELLRASFLECYSNLDADHIVLLFDTIEQASDAAQRFCKEVLPKLKQGGKGQYGTLIIAAGRESLTRFLTNDGIQDYPLKGLSQAEIQQYFRQYSQKRSRQPLQQSASETPQPWITPSFITRVTELSKGRPILIALTIDWLNYGNMPDDFAVQNPEAFERLMVEQIQEIRTPEDQMILAMAQLHRRFDQGFLQTIFGFSETQAEAMIRSLTRFSFVKTHYAADGEIVSCLLHDEMRRLVLSYVWNRYDPNGELRQEWSAKAVEYYEQLITTLSETQQNLALRQTLERERLSYWLQTDLAAGFSYWRQLYAKAGFPYEKEALNQEVQLFERKLSFEDQLELKFCQSYTDYERRDYLAALEAFATVLAQSSDIALKADIYPMMIYCSTHLSQIEKSLALGAESEAWFRQELDNPLASSEVQDKLQHAYGKTLNAVGYAHRNQGRYDTAIAYYERSLEVLGNLVQADADRASTKTNLAYLFHLTGRDREATAHGKTALKIAERHNNLRQLGLTHNVLGIISANSLREQQASNHFDQALHYFEAREDLRGLALVKIALGRMYRQIGWNKVKPDRQNFASAASNYARAARMLDEAVVHVRYSNQSILIDAYNEKATLLREQSRFAEAIDLYQRSRQAAETIGIAIKVVDNLVDLGVTYDLQGNLPAALQAAKSALETAEPLNSPHLLSRAQRTIANVLFKMGDYDHAIENAVDSCIKILEQDPYSFKNSPAKREVLHEEWLTWLTEDLIQNLPSQALKTAKCEYLIDRWEGAEVLGKVLADHYPGFVITLEDVIAESGNYS